MQDKSDLITFFILVVQDIFYFYFFDVRSMYRDASMATIPALLSRPDTSYVQVRSLDSVRRTGLGRRAGLVATEASLYIERTSKKIKIKNILDNQNEKCNICRLH